PNAFTPVSLTGSITSGAIPLSLWHLRCTSWARGLPQRGRHRDFVTRAGTRDGRRQTWPRKIADPRRWIEPNSARLRAKAEKQRTRKAQRTSGRVRRHGTPAARAASRVTSAVESRWAAATPKIQRRAIPR